MLWLIQTSYHNPRDRQKWWIFCWIGEIALFTSENLLCQNCYILNWYFLQETTHDIVMLDHNVFCITQKRKSLVFLNVTAEMLEKCTLLVKLYMIMIIPNRCGKTERVGAK